MLKETTILNISELGEKMKNKKVLIGIGLLMVICITIGVSYAYWRLTLSQTGTNKIMSRCLELTLTNEENAINLEDAYPLTDEEGRQTTPYRLSL